MTGKMLRLMYLSPVCQDDQAGQHEVWWLVPSSNTSDTTWYPVHSQAPQTWFFNPHSFLPESPLGFAFWNTTLLPFSLPVHFLSTLWSFFLSLEICTVLLSGVPFALLSDPLDDLTCSVASTTSGELVMLNVSELCVLNSSPVHSAVSASPKLSSSSLSPLGNFLFWQVLYDAFKLWC